MYILIEICVKQSGVLSLFLLIFSHINSMISNVIKASVGCMHDDICTTLAVANELVLLVLNVRYMEILIASFAL